MNTAALLGPYHADRVLAWENGHPMTYGRFLSDVGALADLLPEKPTVINLADDRYRFLVVFAAVVFFVPTLGGLFLEPDNFEQANPVSTPEHIAPVWYFTPYYAILRAVPDQRLGALLMLLSVLLFLFLPWLDRSPVRSIRYKGWLSRSFLAMFAVSFVALGYLGLQPAEGRYVLLARFFAVFYFAFFWLMPLYTRFERVKAPPERLR